LDLGPSSKVVLKERIEHRYNKQTDISLDYPIMLMVVFLALLKVLLFATAFSAEVVAGT
jgi:hypothetical protein